ncbi:MAG TPA: ATP-binding protein, partial [Caldimonas sp.]|nr:ATP-binding protein [Caldimonas sp.]
TGSWDAGRLHQVLANLVVNALKYGSGQAPIVIRLDGSENDVVFSVHNQGDVIAQATLDRMFAPLTRGSDAGQREGSMGLGLYICREIVVAHKGEISSASDASGTTFTVRLPR